MPSSKHRKETDLIYEGIATSWLLNGRPCSWLLKETDLIYEGIATLQFIFSLLSRFCKETDLIYEGIATAGICLPDSV